MIMISFQIQRVLMMMKKIIIEVGDMDKEIVDIWVVEVEVEDMEDMGIYMGMRKIKGNNMLEVVMGTTEAISIIIKNVRFV
jgi:hypothetical protein